MNKVLVYVKGEVVECWKTQASFAEARELVVGTIRNSISLKGYYRDKDGGVLRYVEVKGEDSRKSNRFGKQGTLNIPFKKKAVVKTGEEELPGFG